MVWIIPGISSFLVGGPSSFSLECWGRSLVWGVWFPSHLPLEGTDLIQKFWAITDGPRYPG
jgi:hypothetical protein